MFKRNCKGENCQITVGDGFEYFQKGHKIKKKDMSIFNGSSLSLRYNAYASAFGNPDSSSGPCAATPTVVISGGVLTCSFDCSSGSKYWRCGGVVLNPVDLLGYKTLYITCNDSYAGSQQFHDVFLLDATKDVLTSRMSFISVGSLKKATTISFDVTKYDIPMYIIIYGQSHDSIIRSKITSMQLIAL